MKKIEIVLPPDAEALPDHKGFTERYNIRSNSGAVYVIARNFKSRKFGCSCAGWCTKGYCKHLRTLGIPETHSHKNTSVVSEEIIIIAPVKSIQSKEVLKVNNLRSRIIDLED